MLDTYPEATTKASEPCRRHAEEEMTAIGAISRSFRARRRELAGAQDRVPPGQYLTDLFPVWSACYMPETATCGV